MITNSMEPKGFSIKIETITSGKSGTEVTQASLKDLLKNIEHVITSHFMADGNQQIGLSIQACDQTFDMEESVVDLTDFSPAIMPDPNDYTRQYWIETKAGNDTSDIGNVNLFANIPIIRSSASPVLSYASHTQY